MNTTPEPGPEPGTGTGTGTGTESGFGPAPDTAPPPPGTAVRDPVRDRVGIVMGHEGSYLRLRPLVGGREWDADPARVQPLNPQELLRARVAEANACSRRAMRERIELPQIEQLEQIHPGGDLANDESEDILKGTGPSDQTPG